MVKISSKVLLRSVVSKIKSKKALDISILDVSRISSEFDYMVISTVQTENQMKSIVEEIEKLSEAKGFSIYSKDLEYKSGWVVLDLYYVVVHLMFPEVRDYYNLERIWALPESVGV